LDVIVEAARRVRGQSDAEKSRLSREASIAHLRDRRARLMRDIQKIEATIGILRGEAG
jgi:hypothetical protein